MFKVSARTIEGLTVYKSCLSQQDVICCLQNWDARAGYFDLQVENGKGEKLSGHDFMKNCKLVSSLTADIDEFGKQGLS
jgi:hypothetical protein